MAGLDISEPAREDLAKILATSASRWGDAAQARHAKLLGAAIRAVARRPHGPATRDRSELYGGLRSLHIRHVRGSRGVKDPVHVVYYRPGEDVVEIVRVLHERMEPSLHIGTRRRGATSRR